MVKTKITHDNNSFLPKILSPTLFSLSINTNNQLLFRKTRSNRGLKEEHDERISVHQCKTQVPPNQS